MSNPTAPQGDQCSKSAEAKANLRLAEQTFRLGLQMAQTGAVDRGLFLMLNAWRQAPADAIAFRRVVRANLAGWSRQLPRLRQALRLEKAKGREHSLIAPGDPDGRTFLTWLEGQPNPLDVSPAGARSTGGGCALSPAHGTESFPASVALAFAWALRVRRRARLQS